MALTKYARYDGAQVLDLKGSKQRARHASLAKLADFDDYRTEDGYLYARIRAISSRVNKNHDGWPSVELAGGEDVFHRQASTTGGFTVEADAGRDYGYSTFLGKPIFVDHHNSDPTRARGVIVDAKLHVDDAKTSSLDPYYGSDDVDPEHLPPTWVELLLEVDAKAFPKLAKAIIEGSRDPNKGIDGFSMGCDVERSVCSICKNAASAPEEYCKHVRMKGAHHDFFDHDGTKTSKKSYENCYGIKFFEISAVFDPADETALLRDVRSSVHKEAGPFDQDSEWAQGKRDLGREMAIQGYDDPEAVRTQLASPTCPHCGGLAPGHASGAADVCRCNPPHVASVRTAEEIPWDNPNQWAEHQFIPHQADSNTGQPPEGTGYLHHLREGTQFSDAQGTPFQFLQHGPTQGSVVVRGPQGYDQFAGDSIVTPHEDPQMSLLGSTHTADNPLPQSDQPHAPEEIDTLREEKVCPVCGSSMDEETCEICGYTEPPESFQNPDLEKAKETDLRQDESEDQDDQGEQELTIPPEDAGQAKPQSPPMNPGAVAHVTGDMDWEVSHHIAQVNKSERPVTPGNKPVSDEPKDNVLKDQTKPVTSSVRTASDFIAAAGATKRDQMNHTADAASGAPADAKPDVNVDVEGVGGVDDASNEAASKADGQVDVLNKGGTGVEGVAADSTTNVEQGDEHSKNIEAIPTKTFDDGSSGVERQHDPVTGEPFPASADGVKAAHWEVTALDNAAFPEDDGGVGGGSATKGVQPADPVGVAEDRVNVLDSVTSPENNSGPTTTWSGTDGNGVLRQQDPTTPQSIALGESGLEGGGVYESNPARSSAHIFTAMKVADLEVELGLAQERYARAGELENEHPEKVATILETLQRVKATKPRGKTAGTQRLPVLGRPSEMTSSVKEDEAPAEDADPSFMFGSV